MVNAQVAQDIMGTLMLSSSAGTPRPIWGLKLGFRSLRSYNGFLAGLGEVVVVLGGGS